MILENFQRMAYLMVAYSHGKWVERAKIADIAAAYLMEIHNYAVFSPISQSHRVARYVSSGHLSHEFWLGQDVRFMDACEVGVVLEDEAWKKSFGVAWELGWFTAKQKEVWFLPIDTVKKWAKSKGIEI